MKVIFLENSKNENQHNTTDNKNEEVRINYYVKLLILVAIISIVSASFFIFKLDSKLSSESIISADYVSVFKESELHEMLFNLNEN